MTIQDLKKYRGYKPVDTAVKIAIQKILPTITTQTPLIAKYRGFRWTIHFAEQNNITVKTTAGQITIPIQLVIDTINAQNTPINIHNQT